MSGKCSIHVDFSTLVTEEDLARVVQQVQTLAECRLLDGTGDGQADAAWATSQSVPGGYSPTVELDNLTSLSGASLEFATVKVLLVRNAGTVDLTLRGNVDALGGASLVLEPGAAFCVFSSAGWEVDGSSNEITIDNLTETEGEFEIVTIGEEA